MTNNEAKDYLTALWGSDDISIDETIALEMAIKALEQTQKTWGLDDARKDFMNDVYNTLDFLPTNNEANRIIDSFDRVTSGLEQQPCEDAISRKDMLAVLRQSHSLTQAWDGFEKLPSVTPKEKTGHWISFGIQGEIDGQIVRAFTCSKCGAISIFRMTGGKIINGDLCPNCGAKLVEPQESEG